MKTRIDLVQANNGVNLARYGASSDRTVAARSENTPENGVWQLSPRKDE